jgi:hypothetical protein
MRSVVFSTRSRRKMSRWLFVSPVTRLVAELVKATKRPSAESWGEPLMPLACTPAVLRLMRSVAPVARSCTKTSQVRFVSPGTRLSAALWKAT